MRVLVTGAAGGIGAAIVTELAGRGHQVVGTARDAARLDGLPVAQALAMDVTDDASVAAAAGAWGDLDAVVNNAGIIASGPMEGFPVERLRQVLDTNTVGPMRVVAPLLGAWRRRGHGVIVNVSSIQGRVSTPLEGAYAASKHALEALSECLYLELGHFGIRVVLIEPGYTAPGMAHGEDHVGPAEYEELRRQWAGTAETLNGPAGRTAPGVVGRAVADALEDPATPLRVPTGQDAETVLGLRDQMDDATFEATMRQALGLTW